MLRAMLLLLGLIVLGKSFAVWRLDFLPSLEELYEQGRHPSGLDMLVPGADRLMQNSAWNDVVENGLMSLLLLVVGLTTLMASWNPSLLD